MGALSAANLPYLTADLPGVGGRIKESPDDFRVDEVPLYEPCGEGTHVYFRVMKAGITTPEAAGRIARHMAVRPDQIGIAGLKDARALTTQMMSLEHADPARLAACRDARVSVEVLSRHTNKLRPGHLRGNRFTIIIRGVGQAELPAAGRIVEVLQRRGTPNYFGQQRFGARDDTAALGRALVKDDLDEFVAILLGRPRADDPPDCQAARDAFDAGRYDRALDRWPWHYANERKALAAFRKKLRADAAVRAVDKRMKRLYVSAFQSLMFNEILVARIDTLDRVLVGDLAQKTDTGGVFLAEDAEKEQPRAQGFQISPTGAIAGYRSSLAAGEPGRIERQVLARHEVALDDFRRIGTLRVKGARRVLRFRLEELDLAPGADPQGQFLRLGFTAPAGSYATVVLREIMKTD